MIGSIEFTSAKVMKTIAPEPNIAVVSILAHDERNHRPYLGKFRRDQVVLLEFDDDADPRLATAPDSGVAGIIHRFIVRMHASERELQLIVHCYAGVSRSAAVAQFAHELTGAPIGFSGPMPHTRQANVLLLRLLRESAGLPHRHWAQSIEHSPSVDREAG